MGVDSLVLNFYLFNIFIKVKNKIKHKLRTRCFHFLLFYLIFCRVNFSQLKGDGDTNVRVCYFRDQNLTYNQSFTSYMELKMSKTDMEGHI